MHGWPASRASTGPGAMAPHLAPDSPDGHQCRQGCLEVVHDRQPGNRRAVAIPRSKGRSPGWLLQCPDTKEQVDGLGSVNLIQASPDQDHQVPRVQVPKLLRIASRRGMPWGADARFLLRHASGVDQEQRPHWPVGSKATPIHQLGSGLAVTYKA